MSDAPIDTAPAPRAEANGAPDQLPARERSGGDVAWAVVMVALFLFSAIALAAIAVTP